MMTIGRERDLLELMCKLYKIGRKHSVETTFKCWCCCYVAIADAHQ
jgi:hypothetical protein